MIARWPGRIAAAATSDHISAFWDVLPTIAEVAGFEPPADCDGVSFLPTLLGKPARQASHEYLYWEFGGARAVRMGDWKAVWPKKAETLALYNLKQDISETTDVAAENPAIVAKIREILSTARTESAQFPLKH